ncbi:GNAT family N-acetyltransferase [Alloiococcus sp. CFN-8]|uniref:GNAT family N-acetyltransferase n=1 Tax=Alloiococcus sp. CFN-8 TaxID=3416081 RepID=UPI003CF9D72A
MIAHNYNEKLLLYCLKNHIEAHWLAFNDISESLAIKLGYIKDEFYKTFLIEHI